MHLVPVLLTWSNLFAHTREMSVFDTAARRPCREMGDNLSLSSSRSHTQNPQWKCPWSIIPRSKKAPFSGGGCGVWLIERHHLLRVVEVGGYRIWRHDIRYGSCKMIGVRRHGRYDYSGGISLFPFLPLLRVLYGCRYRTRCIQNLGTIPWPIRWRSIWQVGVGGVRVGETPMALMQV